MNNYNTFSVGIQQKDTYVLFQNSDDIYDINLAGGGGDGTQRVIWSGDLELIQYNEVREFIQHNPRNNPRPHFDFLQGELMLDSTSDEYYRQRFKSFGINDRYIDTLIDLTSFQKKKLSLACAALSNDQSLFTELIRDSQLYESIAQHINSENISLMDIINILDITNTNYHTLSHENKISLDDIYDIFLRLIVGLLMKGYDAKQISDYITTTFESTFINNFFEPYNSNNNDIILHALLEKFFNDAAAAAAGDGD